MTQEQPKPIQINDNIPGAEYANMMQAGHNKDEFQLIFFSILPPTGRVTGKVITTPGHFKRMIRAMSENLKLYEEKFGEVKEADDPTSEGIGFQDRKK